MPSSFCFRPCSAFVLVDLCRRIPIGVSVVSQRTTWQGGSFCATERVMRRVLMGNVLVACVDCCVKLCLSIEETRPPSLTTQRQHGAVRLRALCCVRNKTPIRRRLTRPCEPDRMPCVLKRHPSCVSVSRRFFCENDRVLCR